MQSLNRKSSVVLYLLLVSLAAFDTLSTAGITKFIPADDSIGTWDPVTRTYTLWADVDETIQIDEDDLILDGAGHSVLGAGSGCGLYLNERTEITVRNLYIEGFSFGIHLHNSSGNILEQNTINGNSRYGIYLQNSNGNTLTDNTTSDNHEGIFLRDSASNDLTANGTSLSARSVVASRFSYRCAISSFIAHSRVLGTVPINSCPVSAAVMSILLPSLVTDTSQVAPDEEMV